MGQKQNKFGNILTGSVPSRSESAKGFTLQSVVEGDRPEYQYIRTEIINLNPKNDYSLADSPEEIKELAEDIKRNGLLHNIVVSYRADGTYTLLSGERRLRAYKLLFAETGDAKYSTIYSLVRKGLSDVDEMIILDAANLQVRNGMNDEKKYRKATARFIDNLKAKFNISEDEAISLTKQYTPVTDAVIDKNITLERDLNPSLLSMLDDGYLSKNQAYEYARLPSAVQDLIASNLETVKMRSVTELKKVSEDISEPAKEIRLFNEMLEKQRQAVKEIKEEIKEIKRTKAVVDFVTASTLDEKQKVLEAQKKQYNAAIKQTEYRIEQKLEDISNAVPEEESTDVKRNAVLAEINSQINGIDKKVNLLVNNNMKAKKGYLTEDDLMAIRLKINKIVLTLEDVIGGLR